MLITNRISIWDEEIDNIPKEPEPQKPSIWKPFFVGFLISILIGTIGIAGIVTLWILDMNSSTSDTTIRTTTSTSITSTTATTTSSTSTTSGTTICSTTAITTTVTSSSLPSQCTSYTLNTDATRAASYTGSSVCDSTTFSSATWVRFSGLAGTLIATCPVANSHCGTDASGWYSGVYPSTAGSSTSGTVCYNYAGNTCIWSNSITITNCNGYYVFLLSAPTVCSSRYCTI